MIPAVVSLEDVEFLALKYSGVEHNFLIVLNFATREVSKAYDVADVLLRTGALSKCYGLLRRELEEGFKAAVLQIIANTIGHQTLEILSENIEIVLKSGELNIYQPTAREWVFVIIKKVLPLSNEIFEKINKIYQSSLNT